MWRLQVSGVQGPNPRLHLLRMADSLAIAILIGVAVLLGNGTAVQGAATLPEGYVLRPVVHDLELPTDMVLLPNGDFLVTEKGRGLDEASVARVRLVSQGVLRPEPVVTLSTSAQVDSGLAGIVLDPDFSTNGYFYLWHATGQNSPGWDGTPNNRLTRYTYDSATGLADPASAAVILDDAPWDQIHNGGGLSFDDAGNLLIATGDTATPLDPERNLAQDFSSLGGKLLRVRPQPEGGNTIPPDNPFINADGDVRPEIYATGLRNPFRMIRRPIDGQLYLVDVGLATWDEVNLVQPGANYGWPVREGPCPLAKKGSECSPAPPAYTDPVLAYPLPDNGGSVTALTFYIGSSFPESEHGKLFYTDFNNRLLFTADLDAPGVPSELFATDTGMYVDMLATESGIYLLDIVEGTLSLLYYDDGENRPPVPSLAVSPTVGSPPLNVFFSAEGTTDPDDLSLVYHWDFGDGTAPITTTTPTISHRYNVDGNHLASLQVVDVRGGMSAKLAREITVYSGAMPAIVEEIVDAPERRRYEGGDSIRYSVQRSDGQAGLDPDEPYRWRIDLHHNEHTHPVVNEYVGEAITLTIPTESHAREVNIWYQVYLTMRTEEGIEVERDTVLYPNVSHLQVASWPGPVSVLVNQHELEKGVELPVIVGQEYTLATPESIIHDGDVGRFSHWVVAPSWPGETLPDDAEILSERKPVVAASAAPKTYIAYYEYVRAAVRLYVPLVHQDLSSVSAGDMSAVFLHE